MTLHVQYNINQGVKKGFTYEFICAVYLEYLVTINFVWPYPKFTDIICLVTKKKAVEK